MDLPPNGDTPGPGLPEPNPAVGTVECETRGEPGADGNGAPTQAELPDMLEGRELRAILEAMLFVSQEPLSLDRLASLLGEVPRTEIGQALQHLQDAFAEPGRGLQMVEVAGGFRIVTRPDYAPWVKRLEKVKAAPKVSRSALETLAIIAYKQPVVRGEIEQIRGVETSGVLRTLLERKLVRIVGRKEVPGRPILYGTTKFFLEHFGLRGLSELPPLLEFKELGEPEQASLPESEDPLIVDGEAAAQPDPAHAESLPTGT